LARPEPSKYFSKRTESIQDESQIIMETPSLITSQTIGQDSTETLDRLDQGVIDQVRDLKL